MENEIRIYVADLSAYNNGRLHGVWINALLDISDIQDQINKMLKNSPEIFSEEYAIHDYEGFDGYRLSEYESVEKVHNIACFINEHPEIAGKLLDNYCGNLEEAKKAVEENYYGCFKSVVDYVENFTSENHDIPKYLEGYIDYEKMGSDMEMNGDFYSIETAFDEVHIFWNH
ncbi:MAG: antirestriction protein ArdA [Gammaproteobacteria bacterium]|nr:antirestriction protein ArdA [Gammaproteobacteria bacterium]